MTVMRDTNLFALSKLFIQQCYKQIHTYAYTHTLSIFFYFGIYFASFSLTPITGGFMNYYGTGIIFEKCFVKTFDDMANTNLCSCIFIGKSNKGCMFLKNKYRHYFSITLSYTPLNKYLLRNCD